MTHNERYASRRQWLASFSSVAAAGLAGCQGYPGLDSGGIYFGGRPSESDEADGEATSAVDRVLELAVGTNGEGRLSPPVRAVERSERVKIRVVNDGTEPASVDIGAYNIGAEIAPGKRTETTYAFHAPGVFSIDADGLRHSGQLFVYPTSKPRLARTTERQLRLLVDEVAGYRGLYPATVFALEDETVSLEVANTTNAATTVSVAQPGLSASVDSGRSERLSFMPEWPGIYRIGTDATVTGRLVVLPQESDFSRMTATNRRRRLITEREPRRSVPATVVCRENERLVLETLEPGTGGSEDAEELRATAPTAGIYPLAALPGIWRSNSQLVVLP